MKTEDLLHIATVAIATATLTVTSFWAGPTEAGREADTPGPSISKPRLVSHGLEFTVATPGSRVFKAGDQPLFELTACNITNETATTSLSLAMNCSSVPDPLSRAIRAPAVLWTQVQSLTLKPGETKILSLEPRTRLPANSIISVVLSEAELKAHASVPGGLGQARSPQTLPGIVALSFSTAIPGKAGMLVAK